MLKTIIHNQKGFNEPIFDQELMNKLKEAFVIAASEYLNKRFCPVTKELDIIWEELKEVLKSE